MKTAADLRDQLGRLARVAALRSLAARGSCPTPSGRWLAVSSCASRDAVALADVAASALAPSSSKFDGSRARVGESDRGHFVLVWLLLESIAAMRDARAATACQRSSARTAARSVGRRWWCCVEESARLDLRIRL